MNYCLFNANSIRNKINDLNAFVDTYTEKIDVIGITETWLDPEDVFFMNDYYCFRCDRNSNRGGGVVILASNDLLCSEIKLDFDLEHIEAVAIEISLFSCKIVVANVYSRPNCSQSQYDELCKLVHALFQASNQVLLMGDFNLPNISWNEGTASNQYFQSDLLSLFAEYGLDQRVLEPTHVRGNVLDLVFVSDSNMIYDVDIKHPLTPQCDHNIITFRGFATPVPNSENNIPEKRFNFRKTNFSELRTYLHNVNWDEMRFNFDTFTTQKFADLFYTILFGGIELFTPLAKVSVKSLKFGWSSETLEAKMIGKLC